MKRCSLVALCLFVLGCVTVGEPAPAERPTALARRGGGEVPLRPEAGRLLLVDFFASWCVPCREALPHHAALAKQYEGRVDFLLVSVDEDPAALEALLAKLGELPFPVGLDPQGRAAGGFRITVLPTAVLLDAGGGERWRGAAYTEAELDGALESAVR